MGKSTLMAQLATSAGVVLHQGASAPDPVSPLTLWDIPPSSTPGPLQALFPPGTRLVVAKRPDTPLAGLPRALLYTDHRIFGAADLLVTEAELADRLGPVEACRFVRATAGWPLLLSCSDPDPDTLSRFLQEEVIEPLPPPDLAHLVAALAPGRDRSDALLAFLPASADGPLRALLQAAVMRVLSRRTQSRPTAFALAQAFAEHGDLPQAIDAYHHAKRPDLALQCLIRGQADFFIHLYGAEAFDRALAPFPADFVRQHEVLMICAAMQALKRGDLPHARRLIAEWHGPSGNDPASVFASGSGYSFEFRAFRLVMLIYEDLPLTDDLLARAFCLLDDIPADAHRARGSFYNAILEFFIRSRRFAEAEEVAHCAGQHYQMAKVPLLSFYISLHQSIIRLMTGDPVAARRYAQTAQSDLALVPFESPPDHRLLTLLVACIDYEGGHVVPLARFLSREIDDFSRSEIWPSLIELTLHYGSLALCEHYSTQAARSFLDRWRLSQQRNPHRALVIDQHDVTVLQNGNRWQQAAERLTSLPGRITRSWVLSNGSELSRLTDRNEVATALLCARQMCFDAPNRPGLLETLAAIAGNLHLTARQRIGAEIWLAHCHRRRRNLSAARATLLKTFETVARLGAIAPLLEERAFLADLLAHKQIAPFLELSASAREVLRRLGAARLSTAGASGPAGSHHGPLPANPSVTELSVTEPSVTGPALAKSAGPNSGPDDRDSDILSDNGLGHPPLGLASAGRTTGLTRQEVRILQTLCEGGSNKFIAHALGLSEATVKFHLANSYRKLGCQNRRQAMQCAAGLGLIV